MDLYWLEQTVADVPLDDSWLSAREAEFLQKLRFAKRRADWRLGRWTAKRALAICLHVPGSRPVLGQIEVISASSGAPEVFFAGKPAAISISLSHRAGAAICAVALSAGAAVGCDLEAIEPRSDAFVADYFTAEEQALVAMATPADRPPLLALLWSAKESALKALGQGLRLDTRCVSVHPSLAMPTESEGGLERCSGAFTCLPSNGLEAWRPLRIRYTRDQVFYGWWQRAGHLLQTLVATPPPAFPTRLVSAELGDSTRRPDQFDDPLLHQDTTG
jgi:4'-phosphopantetheinyl transferase